MSSKTVFLTICCIFIAMALMRPVIGFIRLRRSIAKHWDSLITQYLTLTYDDGFGKIYEKRFEKKASYFLRNHSKATGIGESFAIRYILYRVRHMAANKQPTFSSNMDPFEYESLCAALLKAAGWVASKTALSHDQGGDVLAEKGNLRLIVQCKLCKKKVGNQAVQQITAAQRYYRCNLAAVVTNASYTDSARQLAKVNNILLLHHSDLSKLDFLLP